MAWRCPRRPRTGRARARATPGTAARSGPAAGPRRRRRAACRSCRGTRSGGVAPSTRTCRFRRGRQAERAVGRRVLVVAHPDQRGLEQAHDRGEHFLPGKPRTSEIRSHPSAERWQPLGEQQEAPVLGRIPDLSPARVIAVLLATPGVSAHRLDMPVRRGANPHLGPRGRDHQGANATPRREIADGGPVCRSVAEASAHAKTCDPGAAVRHVAKRRRFGGGDGLGGRRRWAGDPDSALATGRGGHAVGAHYGDQGASALPRWLWNPRVARMTSRRQDDDSVILASEANRAGNSLDARLDGALQRHGPGARRVIRRTA